MLDEKIDELRKNLNEMMDREDGDRDRILQISQELDVLIVEYYKEMGIYEE